MRRKRKEKTPLIRALSADFPFSRKGFLDGLFLSLRQRRIHNFVINGILAESVFLNESDVPFVLGLLGFSLAFLSHWRPSSPRISGKKTKPFLESLAGARQTAGSGRSIRSASSSTKLLPFPLILFPRFLF
jgi:hypothetical protein